MCTLAAGFLSPRLRISLDQTDKDDDEAQRICRDYARAWKRKEIAALRNLIADDYMAVNFEGKVSDKENEIATAKTDAQWISMTVDEIHTRIFGNTAIASV
ncbi:MAG TPA: nuclear transport factor 2 family protein [Candidatus Acidoferrum sp.]